MHVEPRGRFGKPFTFVERCASTQRLLDGAPEGGVLAEASEGRVVLGIGVNVSQSEDELPADAATPATSLALEGSSVGRSELLAAILERLEAHYDAWISAAGAE